jgi:hypothetical protein
MFWSIAARYSAVLAISCDYAFYKFYQLWFSKELRWLWCVIISKIEWKFGDLNWMSHAKYYKYSQKI